MVGVDTARIGWQLAGDTSLGPITLVGESQLSLNLITGRVLSWRDAWSLSAAPPLAAALYTIQRAAYNVSQVGSAFCFARLQARTWLTRRPAAPSDSAVRCSKCRQSAGKPRRQLGAHIRGSDRSYEILDPAGHRLAGRDAIDFAHRRSLRHRASAQARKRRQMSSALVRRRGKAKF